MSDALGVDVSAARIHTGPVAARKASDAGALAFAAGANVVMGADAPPAGTLEGDALLAHELAHVAQQSGAGADASARRMPIGSESGAAEENADTAAAGALAHLHGGGRDASARASSLLRTELQLQRCPGNRRSAASAFDGDAVNTQIRSGDTAQRSAALAAVVQKMRQEGRDFSVVRGGAPVFDPAHAGEGATSRENPARIVIGPPAMNADWQFLQLVVEHELVHAQQWQDPAAATAMGREEREFLATMREFELVDSLGLRDRRRAYNLTHAQAKLTGWYNRMTADKQSRHRADYDRAMAMQLDP